MIEIVKLEELSSERSEAILLWSGDGAWGKGLVFEAPCPTPAPTEAAEASVAKDA